MSRITALIAEDEAPQRAALLDMLAEAWPALDVVAVCEDGVSALDAAREHRPAVAFLDIRMPGVNGLDVARAVVAGGGLVVFTSAYDDYAIKAFEAGAADYVLKPVQPARLAQAVERLQARLDEPRPTDLQALGENLEARLRPQGLGIEGPQRMQHRLAAFDVRDQVARHLDRRTVTTRIQREQLDGAALVQVHQTV